MINLACMSQEIGEALDRQNHLDVTYTDLSRAIDTIDHQIVLYKISSLGFFRQLSNRLIRICVLADVMF